MANGRGGEPPYIDDTHEAAEEVFWLNERRRLQDENERLRKEIARLKNVHIKKSNTRGNGAADSRGLAAIATLVKGSEIKPTAYQWLWKYFLARGKLEILAGAVGAGKTTIAIEMAATITRGGKWPDGTEAEAGDVLIWSGEDDPEDTLLPRFLAAGGVRERVHFVKSVIVDGKKRAFDPSTDMDALFAAARSIPSLNMII